MWKSQSFHWVLCTACADESLSRRAQTDGHQVPAGSGGRLQFLSHLARTHYICSGAQCRTLTACTLVFLVSSRKNLLPGRGPVSKPHVSAPWKMPQELWGVGVRLFSQHGTACRKTSFLPVGLLPGVVS